MCNLNVNAEQDLDEAKCCGARIIKVHKPWHICMFMASIAEPGAGAYFNGCFCHKDASSGCQFGNLIQAWWMAVTSCILVGWLNSVRFGVGIYRKAK